VEVVWPQLAAVITRGNRPHAIDTGGSDTGRHRCADGGGVETVEHQLEKGDVILLCSDGLHSMINDEAILKTVTPFPATLPAAAQKLIDAANEAGGKDNVSVVLLRYTE